MTSQDVRQNMRQRLHVLDASINTLRENGMSEIRKLTPIKGIQFSRALPDPYLIDPVSHWSLVFESEIFFLLFDLRSDTFTCCIIINAILSPL
ncbi:hypothetical protein XELAEV_18033939mg [Xenopus laevis]|uniref:Uncharacterized protein n=1 Tax=Xenopus laevis TaxID=8355 RepID=A0A974CME8_XENLA|nr:hypothetical protein XELAEV_18033939mg [Xenopus laevis]